MTSKFTQKILDWARQNPGNPDSEFIIENYMEALRKRKEESKRWYMKSFVLMTGVAAEMGNFQ